MAISADSIRICSEYKPGPIQSLARGGGAAMQADVVELPGGSAAARRIQPAVVYMSQNLGTPLQVKTLSTLLGLSSSHFFHLFKRATGFSPIDFFNRMRVRRAIELLEDTTLRMKEVAALLGYADQFYFSRVFKSINGMPPSQYRAEAGFGKTVIASAWDAGSFSRIRPVPNSDRHETFRENGEQFAANTRHARNTSSRE